MHNFLSLHYPMPTLEAAISVFSLRSSSSSSPPTSHLIRNRGLSHPLAVKCAPIQLRNRIQILCAAQDVAVVKEEQKKVAEEVETEEAAAAAENLKRKLFVGNLPWTLTVLDIKKLFSDCGTVVDVEYIKQRDGSGKSRGFSFVTMESGDEAHAVIDKFDSTEVSGRIIRVQFAKSFKKPPPPRPAGAPLPGETRHKIYVSNLAWKVRSNHLRELFSEKVNPVSTKVVFENSSSRSAGYGFVSFATREDAETALSTFNGKELMGRPLRLRFSERTDDASKDEKETENEPEKQEQSLES
ncbi:hypothetical protein QQ045_019336 [Rhodiola kirilowii]